MSVGCSAAVVVEPGCAETDAGLTGFASVPQEATPDGLSSVDSLISDLSGSAESLCD